MSDIAMGEEGLGDAAAKGLLQLSGPMVEAEAVGCSAWRIPVSDP